MLLYAFGSILFALAMMAALTVMWVDFARYRHAMMAALRTLSLDGLPVTAPAPALARGAPVRALRAAVVPAWQPLRGAA